MVMANIRDEVIKLAEMKEKEEIFVAWALGKLIALLDKIPKSKPFHDFQWEVSTLLSKFSCVFMSVLAAIRSGRLLEDIPRMEERLSKTEEGAQLQFVGRSLASLCLEANITAIEIVVYFLNARNNDVVSHAKSVLEKSGQNARSKSATVSILHKWIPHRRDAFAILAKIDAPAAMKRAVNLFLHEDDGIRYEALSILANGPLTQEVADAVVKILKSEKATDIWTSMNHSEVCCDFVKRAFEEGFLSQGDGTEILRTAFRYEYCNRGLASLLPAISAVCPDNRQILMDGFLDMETRKNSHNFFSRKESVKNFIAGLSQEELVDYLQKSLLASGDRDFHWLGGQHLIAADPDAAAQTFLKIVKAKSTLEKIGTLAQLSMKVCRDENFGKWDADELNKEPKSRFTPPALALLEYAANDNCPTEIRLIISYQPGMFGGAVELCRRAIPVLGKIILGEETPAEKAGEALQAILNTRLKKGLAKDVDDELQKIYASPRKEVLLDQMLLIMTNDVRGWPMNPLYPAIVGFLMGAKKADAVPILKKALNAKLPDADLGMSARQIYVAALKKFALDGSAKAAEAIAGYRGDNIWGEIISKTLIDIYEKATSKKVSGQTAIGAAERFLYSVKHPNNGGPFYLDEIIAMEGLKDSPIIQRAFLEGIAAIAGIGNSRSMGMCRLVEKIPVILPPEKAPEARKTLNQLIVDLESEKENHIADCKSKKVCPYKNYIKTIDSLCAEAGLALAVL